ncbi:class I SAM-dependent methyltransferase [Candidatus Solirubrobacter pratensis]|uniref:class I SAM-dependent methyltransferase n=1 Tax=Candidatus Solirubrobacter pratensis TaxID=1298857 RepID=UPI00068751ED|nr:class I SAM-dependent methyltransferase [Candidatus Solirubrobacter pratensis]
MTSTVYDEVRYSNYPYAQTHPDRLATVAILHGLEPPDPFRARVLEVGCGAGGNLLAMAAATPGIRAVGVDLAASAIAEGRAAAEAVGLENLELRQVDVRALTEGELGEFDYVIAHGVYAWIPQDARDALLAAIASHLSPDGLAYVSYNANPGGYFRRMLRDAGLWHARGIEDPMQRATKAQELFRFLRDQRATEADMYGQLIERIIPALADGPLYRLVHDDLGEFWDPVWFADFAAHAGEHGLAFVGEADLSGMRSELLPDEVGPEVWRFAQGDRVAFEQYSDLMIPRVFRQSVLCRAGAEIALEPAPGNAARLHWSARPNAKPLEVGLVADAFAALDGARPRAVGFEALREELGADAVALGAALLDGFRRERLMPHAGPLHAALTPGERPEVSPLARWQAGRGPDLTSLAYQTVRMEEPAARALIELLDGTRDRDAIRAGLLDRTGLELTAEDLEANLTELTRLFLIVP